MGDAVEDIVAEPEEIGFIEASLGKVSDVISSNGWYLIGLAAVAYYVYKNYIKTNLNFSPGGGHVVQSPEEADAVKAKDDARRQAVLKLQDKYKKESDERAVKMKALEEKKRQERLDEIARLEASRGERRLGSSSNNNNSSGKKSFRPEYNPLMGDTTSSSRVCSRPSGGRQGG